jgi:mono/diheme cytochrome c family protein
MKMKAWMAAAAAGLMIGACSGEAATPVAEAPAEPTREEIIAHGKYLVDGVGMCSDCHTPRLADGSFDMGRYLVGAPSPGGPPPPGVPFAPISVALAGLPAAYTEAGLAKFLMDGTAEDGSPPLPPMPHYRLNEKDAAAVAAYLASLPKPAEAPAAPPT